MRNQMQRRAMAVAQAHTNLNTWQGVIAILEGGMLYGADSNHASARRVIEIAKKEQQKWLRISDSQLAAIGELR